MGTSGLFHCEAVERRQGAHELIHCRGEEETHHPRETGPGESDVEDVPDVLQKSPALGLPSPPPNLRRPLLAETHSNQEKKRERT